MKTALVILTLLGSSLVQLSDAQRSGGRSASATGDRSRFTGTPPPRRGVGGPAIGAMGAMGSGAKAKLDGAPKRCGEGQVPSCPEGSQLQRLRDTRSPLCYAAGATEGSEPMCIDKPADWIKPEPARRGSGMGPGEDTPSKPTKDRKPDRAGKGGEDGRPTGSGARRVSGMGPDRPMDKRGLGSGQGPRGQLCESGEKPSCPEGSKFQRRRGTPAPLCYTRGSEEGTTPVCERRVDGDRGSGMAPTRFTELKGAASETQVRTGTVQTPAAEQDPESKRGPGPAVAAESAGDRPVEQARGTESDADAGGASGSVGIVGGVVAAVLGVAVVGAVLYKLVQRRGPEPGQLVANTHEQGAAMGKPVYPESHGKGREAGLSNPMYVGVQPAVGATQHVV